MQTSVNIILNLTSPGHMFAFHFPGPHRFHGFPLNLLLVFHSYDKLMSHDGTPQIETTKWILEKIVAYLGKQIPNHNPFTSSCAQMEKKNRYKPKRENITDLD